MSSNPSSSLVCNLGQSEPDDFGSERNTPPRDLLGCEWRCIPHKHLFKNESALTVFFRNALGSIKTDPRQLEIEDAERKALVEQLRRTYARIADAILWSILAFLLAAVVLLPALGWFAAIILPAGVVSVFWMMWDRIRRI